MTEDYGLTKQEYRKLIEDSTSKASEIAKIINTPKKIYRFRRFGSDDGLNWNESKHWREDVDGICMFSKPDSFNKNDSEDCRVRFDEELVFQYMLKQIEKDLNRCVNDQSELRIRKCFIPKLVVYKDSLQSNMRVGCFTAAGPLDIGMWNDSNFGDKGRGLCIEYNVDNENFRPDGLAFLPVLYDDLPYDNTNAMKTVIDFLCTHSVDAAIKLVCLGYGHTLIKPLRYENEREWRLVIPLRDDNAHMDYFTANKESKRDMCSAIIAMYLGPNIDELAEFNKFKEAVFNTGTKLNIPIYQIVKEKDSLKKVLLA